MWQDRLVKMGACNDAVKFARKFADTEEGFEKAWEDCKDATWMLWLGQKVLDKYGIVEADKYRKLVPASEVLAGLLARVKV